MAGALSWLAVTHPSGHRSLADPSHAIAAHYDWVVVGSGYGASVAALRIAERLGASAPGRVAVLERGREWLPGDFPEDLADLALEVRSPLRPLGLLEHNRHVAADVDVICASGLGGTSLLNAAIAFRPEAEVFQQAEWPRALREDAEGGVLAEAFARAESMLRPTTSPLTRTLPRSRAHRSRFGGDPRAIPTGELPLAVNHEPGRTSDGVRQRACTACGNCCGGCNVGAKNTLTTTYLPRAKDRGAAIFTEIEVTHLEKIPALGTSPRWLVHYERRETNLFGFCSVHRGAITARHVVLGAGSAGTTRLLMRSAREGLLLSDRLGTRVSANGDVLGAVYNPDVRVGALPLRDTRAVPPDSARIGQTITVYADFRSADRPLLERFLLLDGIIPRPFVPHAARLLPLHPSAVMAAATSPDAALRLVRDATTMDYPVSNGALAHSMILLACGHDSSGGRYVASGDDLYVTWPGVGEEASFRAMRREMERYAAHLRGVFIENPRSTFAGGGVLQATHPLGGAPMGETVADGVVDHLGAVLDPAGTRHEGLHVLDAAAIPRSLGAPPLLTITALAERAIARILDAAG